MQISLCAQTQLRVFTSYPKWSPQSLFGDGAERALLTISDEWVYEREFRIVGLGEALHVHSRILTYWRGISSRSPREPFRPSLLAVNQTTRRLAKW